MAVLMAAEPLLSAEEKATEKVRFGNFEVVNDSEGRPVLLGKGTFGRTDQARHCFLDIIVALKIITERYVADAAVRPRSSTVSPLATPTLLTSKPPLHGGTSEHQIQDTAAPSMTQRRNELGIPGSATPLAWEQRIAACLAKEPSQRPQSATEGDEALGGRRVRIDR